MVAQMMATKNEMKFVDLSNALVLKGNQNLCNSVQLFSLT